ncbi:MAG: type II secretion system protein M [Gammaproteobacteria bacterium]|nr:type II secretion system protein M [Gammaproteobacteria bacterium]
MFAFFQKWSSLKRSEQQLLLYGVPLILIAIIYFYIWVPYNQSIVNLKQQVTSTQEDIMWLTKLSTQIKELKTGTLSKGSFTGSFINVVDKSIKQNKLNKYVTLLEKSGDDNIVVKYEKINFDQLIKYLGYIKNRYGISIKSIDVQRTNDGKLVNSRFILKKL